MPPKPEQTTEAYDEWVASQAAEKEDDTPADSEQDRIEAAVQKALADERERVGAAAPQSLVPNHAGGIGVDAHEGTWSQYDQEQAQRGEHPLQSK
jgi:hypothetical protein